MSGSTRRKDDTEGDAALRELVNSILSGRYGEETYLADVSSVCRARPKAAPRLITLLDRHVRSGRIQAVQHQRIKARIEEVLAQLASHGAPTQVSPRAAASRAVFEAPPDAAVDEEEDEDCPTSQLVAAPKARRPAALTTILKPPEESARADEQTKVLSQRGAAPRPERTRIMPSRVSPPPPQVPAASGDASHMARPAPGPVAAGNSLPPEHPTGWAPEPAVEPSREAALTRVLPHTRHLPSLQFLGPTEVAPHADDTQLRSPLSPPPASVEEDAFSSGSASIGVGTVLHDRYELKQPLGRGGIATVYKAVDRYRINLGLEDCYIAVKIVQPDPSRPGSVAALGREFHNAQLLSHPNVINVFNIDHAGDASFYTMELLDGERLSQVVKRVGMLSRRHALAVIRDIGAAVSHAHSRGVVHADLKPHNIMITQNGALRVLDFGSGIIRAREPWISELSPADNYRQATPAYASCEQLEGWSADPRDDIYALACVAYLLLAGRHPFNMRPSLEARAARMHPRRPPGLSGESWRALQRGLAWTREERTMSVDEWLRDVGIDKAAASLPPLALMHAGRPSGTWLQRAAAASVVVAALGLAAFTVEHQDDFDWQSALTRVQDRVMGVWDSLTDSRPTNIDQPAVSLPPIPAPSPVVAQKNIRELAATRVDDSPVVASPIAAVAAAPSPRLVRDDPATVVATHLQFSAPSYVVAGTEPAARIVIRRNGGNTEGDLNFVWWTEEATAKAGVDYASLGRRAERIPSGTDKITVYVPIISSSERHATTQFYVTVSETGQHGGGPESRSVVTIDNGS